MFLLLGVSPANCCCNFILSEVTLIVQTPAAAAVPAFLAEFFFTELPSFLPPFIDLSASGSFYHLFSLSNFIIWGI